MPLLIVRMLDFACSSRLVHTGVAAVALVHLKECYDNLCATPSWSESLMLLLLLRVCMQQLTEPRVHCQLQTGGAALTCVAAFLYSFGSMPQRVCSAQLGLLMSTHDI